MKTVARVMAFSSIFILSIGGLVGIGVYFFTPHQSLILPSTPTSWADEIRTLGGDQAYQKMLATYRHASNSEQHRQAHDFGHALYTVLGTQGFTVCGQDFTGGCLHEFVGTAIQTEGVGVLQKLNQSCLERYSPTDAVICQHGFGHGLVAYFGYTEKNLNQALALCSEIDGVNPTRGCYGGAFMEYNSRTMADYTLRAYTPEDPFGLCKTVGNAYASSCYFWSTQWLLQVLYEKDFGIEAFSGVGTTCETLTGDAAHSCFQGLGYFASPATEYDRLGTRALCNAVSATPAYQEDCWNEASQNLRN